jgi:hypothetical protein
MYFLAFADPWGLLSIYHNSPSVIGNAVPDAMGLEMDIAHS